MTKKLFILDSKLTSRSLRIETLQTLFTVNCGVSQQNSWLIGCMGTVSSWNCENNEKVDNSMSFYWNVVLKLVLPKSPPCSMSVPCVLKIVCNNHYMSSKLQDSPSPHPQSANSSSWRRSSQDQLCRMFHPYKFLSCNDSNVLHQFAFRQLLHVMSLKALLWMLMPFWGSQRCSHSPGLPSWVSPSFRGSQWCLVNSGWELSRAEFPLEVTGMLGLPFSEIFGLRWPNCGVDLLQKSEEQHLCNARKRIENL